MLQLEFEPIQKETLVFVQEEPALEFALPQVFTQPTLTELRRRKLGNPEALVGRILSTHNANPQVGLGREYQELTTEFQPLFTWGMACWDYLLTTKGCRFLPRHTNNSPYIRGDYRAMTAKDFSRLLHRVFRHCMLSFAQTPEAPLLSTWLKERFWPLTLEAYKQLEKSSDPRYRNLTPYSYLRCVPYEFLNEIHQELVADAVIKLSPIEQRTIKTYFLNFHTATATAESLSISLEECQRWLHQGLTKLLINNRLTYCLLRQIERY